MTWRGNQQAAQMEKIRQEVRAAMKFINTNLLDFPLSLPPSPSLSHPSPPTLSALNGPNTIELNHPLESSISVF